MGGMDWCSSVGRSSVGKTVWVMSPHPIALYTCGLFPGARFRPKILYDL